MPASASPDELAGEDDREGRDKVAEEMRELRALEPDAERGVIGERQQRDVEQHFVDAVPVGEIGDERRVRAAPPLRRGLDVAEHQPDAGQQDQVGAENDRRESVVDAQQAERRSGRRAPRARRGRAPPAARGMPERDQAMRQMIAAADHRGAARHLRVTVTNVVSKIGISRIRRGTAAIDASCDGPQPRRRKQRQRRQAKDPRNRLPLSPMKIDAGWKL